jgi:TetR/AcrR family transcriptional regulator, regulator of cefoperazone and chloramphenicol sensitivity
MPVEDTTDRSRKSQAACEAKERLIEAGVDLFGRYGFDGISTRSLADAAKVNLAAIQYHFGGKEGLYLAVARHIVDRVGSWSYPVISRIDGSLAEINPDPATRFGLLCELLDGIIENVLGSPESKRWMGIFIREQIEPSEAFDILFEGVMGPLHRCLCSLMGPILDLETDDPETRLRAFTIMGPVFIFRFSQAEIDRVMNWPAYGPEELHRIRRIVLEHVQVVLGFPRETLEAYFKTKPTFHGTSA